MPAPWSPAQRIAFRFAFAYLVAFCFPVPEGFAGLPWDPVQDGWHLLVPWVGARLLHLAAPISIGMTGSGDTTYSFVRLLCVAVLAVVATVVWSILDRRRKEYATLHAWLRVYVRYVLAMIMVEYGLIRDPRPAVPAPGPEAADGDVRRLVADGAALDLHGRCAGVPDRRRARRAPRGRARVVSPHHHARGADRGGGHVERGDDELLLRRARQAGVGSHRRSWPASCSSPRSPASRGSSC